MYKKHLKAIEKSLIFKGIPTEELNTMLNCLMPKIHRYKKGECITLAGEKYTGIGILLSGSVSIAKENMAGTRVILDILKSGDSFGEMVAFSELKEWPATVIAQEDCDLIYMPPEKIVGECERLCVSHRGLINNMLVILSRKAFILNRKIEYLGIKSIRGKIISYLLEQYSSFGQTTFLMPMKRNELADFLNVSRPSLSREMCRIRDEGMIEFHRSTVKIKDIKQLKSAWE